MSPRAREPGRRVPPPARPDAVDQRRTRSLEEPLDVRLRSRQPYPLLEVRNPLHGTGYLVMLPEFPGRDVALCTCTDFARRGLGTCKHIEAAVRWLGEHADAKPSRAAAPSPVPATAIWRRIDQRLGSSGRASGPAAQRWRRAGATLFEGVEE